MTTELDHCSALYELKFSARRVHESFGAMSNPVQMLCICSLIRALHSLPLSDAQILSVSPFHLIVYICMLEFMLASLDSFFTPENDIFSLLHVSFRSNEKYAPRSHSFIAHYFFALMPELFFWQLA